MASQSLPKVRQLSVESGANALVAATGEFLLAADGCSIDLQSGPLLPRSAYVEVPDEPAVALAISTLDQGAELILVRGYDTALDRNSIRIEFNDEDIGALDPANSAVLAIEIDAGLQVRAIVTERRETPDGPILLLELT